MSDNTLSKDAQRLLAEVELAPTDISFAVLSKLGPVKVLQAMAELVASGRVGAFKGMHGEAVWTDVRELWEEPLM